MVKLLKVAMASLEESQDARSVTYDEGNGKKDLVVMTGPLSNVYTQALNVYFAKTDVNETDTESASVAVESAAIDTVITNALKDKLEQDNLLSKINLVSDKSDIEEVPTAIIFSTNTTDANKPEVVEVAELESARYEDSGKDWIVFVGPDPSNPDKLIQDAVVLPEGENELNAFNVGDQFRRATEEFYSSRGIKVVVGFESLVEWLKTRSRAI